MWNKVKAFWNELPHEAQAVITLFVTTALTSFLDSLTMGDFSLIQLKKSLLVGLTAGLIAMKAMLSLPSNAQVKLDKKAVKEEEQARADGDK